MTTHKGLILAESACADLHPATLAVCKQLLPIYDKPLIYYPLAVLMQAGIRDILILAEPHAIPQLSTLLADGSQWGLNLQYCVQPGPQGSAHAFLLARDFIDRSPCVLIRTSHIFHGQDLGKLLINVSRRKSCATVFAHRVHHPQCYSIVQFDARGRPVHIEEKPSQPKSNFAITGLYFYDTQVCDLVADFHEFDQNNIEITDINTIYLERGSLNVEILGRGYVWLDTETHDNLLETSHFIATLESHQGLKVACPEEIAWRFGWIDDQSLDKLAKPLRHTGYGRYLNGLLRTPQGSKEVFFG